MVDEILYNLYYTGMSTCSQQYELLQSGYKLPLYANSRGKKRQYNCR